jgi:AraC family transcriptional regulator
MAVTRQVLASGPGWQVADAVCSSGPQDRPFEERHAGVSIAAVTEGTFQYRTSQGSAMLVPGALLLGNPGACFECGHEHAPGDRCLAFHMTPAFLENAGVPHRAFTHPNLPPLAQLVPVLTVAEAARQERDEAAFEELALRLAGAATMLLTQTRAARHASGATRERSRRAEDHCGGTADRA